MHVVKSNMSESTKYNHGRFTDFWRRWSGLRWISQVGTAIYALNKRREWKIQEKRGRRENILWTVELESSIVREWWRRGARAERIGIKRFV